MVNNVLLLLGLIARNGNVKQLLHKGLTFRSISETTRIAIDNGYLTYENSKIILTAKGSEYLETEQSNLKNRRKEDWIQPDFKSRIRKIDKNDIFLPKESDLSF